MSATKTTMKHLQEIAKYQAGDALDTTTASEAADGGLSDALDVVAKNLAVALGAALAEPLASFTASRHFRMSLMF